MHETWLSLKKCSFRLPHEPAWQKMADTIAEVRGETSAWTVSVTLERCLTNLVRKEDRGMQGKESAPNWPTLLWTRLGSLKSKMMDAMLPKINIYTLKLKLNLQQRTNILQFRFQGFGSTCSLGCLKTGNSPNLSPSSHIFIFSPSTYWHTYI